MKTILISILLLTSVSASETEIFFAYGDHNSPPYIELSSEGKVLGGLLYDLAKFVSHDLGLKLKMVHAPRSRLEELVKNGSIHLYCNSNKNWVSNANLYYWYEGVFEDENRVYALSPKHKYINSLDKIKTTLGAIKGFAYHPELENVFRDVGRYNLRSHENLIKFLELKRIDFIISSKNVLEYYFKKKKVRPFPVTNFRSSFSYDCIISKKITIDKEDLFKSIQKFKPLRDFPDTAAKK